MKCWRCGKEATRTRVVKRDDTGFYERPMSKYVRCYCDACAEYTKQKEKEDRELYIKLKKREMFLRACDILEQQNTNMYAYKEAIEAVEEVISEKPDKFDSSYEVLAAIVLVHNRIYSKMQFKVGRYQVDFLLPEFKAVLEIDGDRHEHRKGHDSVRDEKIRNMLGPGWEVIRIPTDRLDENAKKLPEAIRKVLQYKKTGRVDWRNA